MVTLASAGETTWTESGEGQFPSGKGRNRYRKEESEAQQPTPSKRLPTTSSKYSILKMTKMRHRKVHCLSSHSQWLSERFQPRQADSDLNPWLPGRGPASSEENSPPQPTFRMRTVPDICHTDCAWGFSDPRFRQPGTDEGWLCLHLALMIASSAPQNPPSFPLTLPKSQKGKWSPGA